MLLNLQEDETYYFDAIAAERPIRFIEKHCIHYEGRFAGKPFLLHPVQKEIIRAVFGWKERKTGYRRFTQLWIEAAAGFGKSPLLAALGLYGLCADGERGAQVFSLAATHKQARVVFDCAKKFIEQSKALSKALTVTQYLITHAKSFSTWEILSGKGPKAGARPSMVLADEIHEWPKRDAYDSMQGRMAKRTQPLFICATNAGESKETLCGALHEEAEGVLRGVVNNPQLYPVICAADKDADPASPDSWRDANPLLGVTVEEDKVRKEWERSKNNPALLARFRRLYLSQWVQGASKWLNIDDWDACTREFTPEEVAGLPLYIGVDLSLNDDLCAVDYVWASEKRYFVDSEFWIPRETAEEYQRKDQIPYFEWAKLGYITLVPDSTITPQLKRLIALKILARADGHDVKGVFYDRYRANDTVSLLESKGMIAMPMPQGYSLSPGCQELDRRLKERSITFMPNAVMRFCASNVEVKADERGNYWPVKPNAKDKYAGKRSMKIDGISALVTPMTEARKLTFVTPQPAVTRAIII